MKTRKSIPPLRRVWVVEVHFSEWEDRNRWEATTACGLTKRDGQRESRRFAKSNVSTRTRTRLYVAVEE